ncbi:MULTISPECIES: VCBS repeat-containing protein [unclassified Streptomyces]|uniref:FG-GAP repeat domain-containing protein n=1 Tax=unclassified Streptomyces TaxID=2593676 RepID=UPI000DBACCD8|nr:MULTISPECIES: VCBS repeat-containing protein [unclassified Streptomyces]MYT70014.1 VCBS repeat-containing protein [Streptomyces sp. SID8367]RAJ88590.1 VCBS repeat protein [Streptomyces sp. PsTaAH-137]
MTGTRRTTITVATTSTVLLLAALTGCSGDDTAAASTSHRPTTLTGKSARTAELPVPRGTGSRTASDFNGDGAPDLVLDDLAHDGLGDDAGIGIVYGKKKHGLTPGVRQLLSPAKYAAPTKGQIPAAFASEASCDLNADGFTDLVVSTDPPYDGQGRPPVPLQILFGSPGGIAGKGVKVAIPAKARLGNDWPDQPVCGDFDGDGKADLVVHASNGGLSFLPGPFTRSGAPRGTARLVPSSGNVPAGPAADVNGDGTDDVLVRSHGGAARSAVALGGPNGPATAGAAYPAGTDVAFGRFGSAVLTADGIVLKTGRTLPVTGTALDTGDLDGDGRTDLIASGDGKIRLVAGGTRVVKGSPGGGRVIAVADYDGDGRDDLVVQRTSDADPAKDSVLVLTGERTASLVAAKPQVTFSTSEFTAGLPSD